MPSLGRKLCLTILMAIFALGGSGLAWAQSAIVETAGGKVEGGQHCDGKNRSLRRHGKEFAKRMHMVPPAFKCRDGGPLASRGAVFVSLNYRLGTLGFFAHPALEKENPGGPLNFGLLDQIATLKWIQQDTTWFGPEPPISLGHA
jgi:Carboxylesterase family